MLLKLTYFLTKALTTKSTSSTDTAPAGTMTKHLSKARSCQMELTAGPERGGSLGTENRVAYTPVPPSPGESQCRGRRGPARPRRARPGSGSFTHSHASPPGSKSPRTGFIIGTTFFSSSSCRTALWSPSVLFWEMSLEQTRGREASPEAQEEGLHYCSVATSPELPRTRRTPLTQHHTCPPA